MLIWKPYYTIWKQKNNKTGIGVYSVSKYFLDETNEMLSKIFENDPSIISLDAVSSKSINLSKEIFSDWDLIYKYRFTYKWRKLLYCNSRLSL